MKRINTNGDFDIWQLGTAFGPAGSGSMLADMWRYHNTTDAAHRTKRSNDVPAFSDAGRIIRQSLEIEVLTSSSTITAKQNSALVYRGEGSEWLPLHGRSAKQRLWLKSSVPGVYHVGLANGSEAMSCPKPITVGVADVWTPFEVVFPRPPLTEWWFDNRVGYSMYLFLATGSFFFGTTGQWGPGNVAGDSSQVNFNAAVGNTIKIAGWELGAADDAVPAELVRPEDEELRCMRYVEKSFTRNLTPAPGIGIGNGEDSFCALRDGTSHVAGVRRFSVPKRWPPAMTSYNPVSINNQMRDLTVGVDCTKTTFDNVTEFGFRALCQSPASSVSGNTIGFHWLADASLASAGSGSFV